MKTLLTSLTIATIAFSTSVSATNVQFRPGDDTFETKVCYTAATQGLSAAQDLIKAGDKNIKRFTTLLTCNGKPLAHAARTFQQISQEQTQAPRKIRFVTDETLESQVCLDAVMIGVDAALEKHEIQDDNIICNNRDIKTFAKKFARRTASL